MPENLTPENLTPENFASENSIEASTTTSIQTSTKTSSRRSSRPVLIGGLALSAGLALWNGLSHWGSVTAADDGFTTIGLCALGVGGWLWRRRVATVPTIAANKPMGDRQGAVAAIARLGVAISRLQAELDLAIADGQRDAVTLRKQEGLELDEPDKPDQPNDTLAQIQTAIARWQAEQDALTQSLDRQTLTIAVAGAPLVGKSAIVQGLKTAIDARLAIPTTQTTPINQAIQAITWDEITIRATRQARDLTANPAAAAPPSRSPELHRALFADCVLYTIAGDLTASERRDLEQLDRAGQTTIVLWNKSDLVSEIDRDRVLSSIRHQLADLIPADRIMALAAAPRGVMTPRFNSLTVTIEQTAIEPAKERIWQQIQRASCLTIAEIKLSLDRLRRHRAEPIVRRYQWIAATATAANPLPSLDLLASGSIGTQLLLDLGQIYHRNLSIDRARAGFEAIVEMLLKLGLVELSTQAIASLLKSHPVTFLAGSAAQGLSAAYLIHVIGTSAIVYFETQDAESFESLESLKLMGSLGSLGDTDLVQANQLDRPWDRSRFQAILSQTIATTQRAAFLQSLLERAAQHFISDPQSTRTPTNRIQTAIAPNPASQA